MTTQLKTKIQGPVAIIGDLHGQWDKLATILDRLRKAPDFQERWIIFIGDFVDRGPDTRRTIDMVLKLIQEHPRTSAIMGNHEFAMCSALGWLPESEEKNWGDRWLDHYDSGATFESYGAAEEDLNDLAAKVPPEHRDFLVNLPWCIEHSQLLFVHAGLDPNIPFDIQLRILRQKDFTLVRPQWLCEQAFVTMDPPEDCPFTVVSGHVKVNKVIIRPRRILVDTTGGDSGELSCVLMPERSVITSSRTEKKPTVYNESGAWDWLKFWR
jgi:serine/threonine protein phosphatase 1